MAFPEVHGVQIRICEVRSLKIAVACVHHAEVRPHQPRALQPDSLKKRTGYVDSDQLDPVSIQFLQGVDSSSAPTFSLRSIDHLPGLVMPLFHPIAGFGKVKNHGDEYAERFQVIQHFQESPIAEHICNPLAHPLQSKKRDHPDALCVPYSFPPGQRSLPADLNFHVLPSWSCFACLA